MLKNDNPPFFIDNNVYFCITYHMVKSMGTYRQIIISNDVAADLRNVINEVKPDKTFVVTDETAERVCLPLIQGVDCIRTAPVIAVGVSDVHKDIESVEHVWRLLSEKGATRHSCVVNIGGGMVTDLGGFAASTFKRGVSFINVPTTLLAMVDASVGGKTGVNFNGLKNEIGVFSDACGVIICTEFLRTLDAGNMASGYAEMLKHGLISDVDTWRELVTFDLFRPDFRQLQGMVARSVAVKERIVAADPFERGLRKALNFGHTAGHAFEELALRRCQPVLHGHAVACGMVCELYMSCVKTGFPIGLMRQTVAFIRDNYGRLNVDCDDYPELYELMKHDKKNVSDVINFTLLAGIGDVRTDQTATRKEIYDAFDFYREGL